MKSGVHVGAGGREVYGDGSLDFRVLWTAGTSQQCVSKPSLASIIKITELLKLYTLKNNLNEIPNL